MHKTKIAICAVILIAIVVVAYFFFGTDITPFSRNDSPINGDFVGISVHSLSVKDAQLVADSGAKWVRIDVSKDLGDAVLNAKAFNLSVLAILDSWMFDKSCIFTLEDWQSNVTYYVSEFADYADAWEIWNEPANPTYPLLDLNLNITAQGSQENLTRIVQFYYDMTQTASLIIKEHDPSAKIVLFGGLNLYSGGEEHLELDMDFVSQLVHMNIDEYGDAISIHAYSWNGIHVTTQDVWNSFTQSLNYYRALFPGKEVWLTETGQQFDSSKETVQPQYVVDALKFFRNNVVHLFWYSLYDNSWELPQQFGLVNNDGTPRNAYNALQTIIPRYGFLLQNSC